MSVVTKPDKTQIPAGPDGQGTAWPIMLTATKPTGSGPANDSSSLVLGLLLCGV
jgi:hypothetical protein